MTMTAASARPEMAKMARGESVVAGGCASAAPPSAGRGGDLRGLAELLLRTLALLRPVPRIAAGIRVLRDPEHQLVEPHTQMRRLRRHERGGRHSRLCVHLQQNQNFLTVVITKVASSNSATTKRGMRSLGVALGKFDDVGRNPGRHDVAG